MENTSFVKRENFCRSSASIPWLSPIPKGYRIFRNNRMAIFVRCKEGIMTPRLNRDESIRRKEKNEKEKPRVIESNDNNVEDNDVRICCQFFISSYHHHHHVHERWQTAYSVYQDNPFFMFIPFFLSFFCLFCFVPPFFMFYVCYQASLQFSQPYMLWQWHASCLFIISRLYFMQIVYMLLILFLSLFYSQRKTFGKCIQISLYMTGGGYARHYITFTR